jgi:hypothetical protein
MNNSRNTWTMTSAARATRRRVRYPNIDPHPICAETAQ